MPHFPLCLRQANLSLYPDYSYYCFFTQATHFSTHYSSSFCPQLPPATVWCVAPSVSRSLACLSPSTTPSAHPGSPHRLVAKFQTSSMWPTWCVCNSVHYKKGVKWCSFTCLLNLVGNGCTEISCVYTYHIFHEWGYIMWMPGKTTITRNKT